MVKKLL
jgi:tRNA-binding EMAP/Myf-like protein